MAAVACLALSADGKEVLLILRRDIPLWALPGGGIEQGEKPMDAAIREFFEETNIQAKKAIFKGVYLPTCSLAEKTYLFVMILPEVFKIEAQKSECRDAKFFSLDNLPRKMPAFYENWIEDGLKRDEPPFEKPMKNMGWVDFFMIVVKHPILTARFLLSKMGCPINTK